MKAYNLKIPARTVFLILLQLFTVIAFTQNSGGNFEEGPLMNRTRIVPFISAIDDQTALIVGGREYGFVSSQYTDIYDASAGIFTEVEMNYPHDGEYVVKLSDGKYFIVGGSYDLGIPAYAHTEIFDPATNEFTITADMQYGRMQTSAAQLTDGRVLVTCAWYDNSAAAMAEIYDIEENVFSSAGVLLTPRASGILLPTSDGGAVLCSGWPSYGGSFYSTVEYFNSELNVFEPYLAEPIEEDPGWYILPLTKPYHDLQLNDGSYILLAYRPGELTEYGIMKFDPATKSFSILKSFQLNSIITNGGFLDLAVNKNANLIYLLGIQAESDPWNIGLITYDITADETYYPDELYQLGNEEYLYSSMIYLPGSGKILLVGISTQTATYFYATNKTFLITPEINTAVANQYISQGNMQISPNPNNGNFTIQMTISDPGDYRFSITDLSGRVVYSRSEIEGGTGDIIKNISLPDLPSGIYQIAVHGGSEWFTQSFAIADE